MTNLLYRIYLLLIALPLVVVATILAGVLTIIGTALGGGRFWGYWPAHIWARV